MCCEENGYGRGPVDSKLEVAARSGRQVLSVGMDGSIGTTRGRLGSSSDEVELRLNCDPRGRKDRWRRGETAPEPPGLPGGCRAAAAGCWLCGGGWRGDCVCCGARVVGDSTRCTTFGRCDSDETEAVEAPASITCRWASGPLLLI